LATKQSRFIREICRDQPSISPALFNIFIEPLLHKLNEEFHIEDIFGYADDIAVCVYSMNQLTRAIKIINEWSTDAGIPINYKKSGILNIQKNSKTRKIAHEESYLNYPIVRYKYLDVWIDENSKLKITCRCTD